VYFVQWYQEPFAGPGCSLKGLDMLSSIFDDDLKTKL
jgi:hypothetical protein